MNDQKFSSLKGEEHTAL